MNKQNLFRLAVAVMALLAVGMQAQAQCPTCAGGRCVGSLVRPLAAFTPAPQASSCACGVNCPLGGNCASCVCAAPVAKWHPDAQGSADLGLWIGETFLGRWYADERVYRPWDGKDYCVQCAVPSIAPPRPALLRLGGCASGACGVRR